MTPDTPSRGTRAPLPPPAAAIATFVLLAAFLGGIVAPSAMMLWVGSHPTTVIAEGTVGTFESASSSPGGLFGPTLTSVQTSTGSIIVRDAFSALRNEPLIVTASNKQKRLQLCTVEPRPICATIEGHWAGRLMPTTPVRHTVNFVQHGFSTHNLDQWLALGMMITFAAVALTAATADRHDPDDHNDDPT